MKNLLFLIGFAAAVALTNALAAAAQPPVVPRLHIWTQPPVGGIVDEQSKARQRALDEIRKRIKPKVAVLVDEDATDTVSIQIMEVASKATSSYTNWGFGIISANKNQALRAEIAFRDYHGELVCETRSKYAEDLADNCKKKIEQWLKDNRAVLAR